MLVWCLGHGVEAEDVDVDLLARLALDSGEEPYFTTWRDDPEQPKAFGVWVGRDEDSELVGIGDTASASLRDAIATVSAWQ